ARVTNSVFEQNASGVAGTAAPDRNGRGFNQPAVVFVRSSQPIFVNNTIRNNVDTDDASFIAAINANVNALHHERVVDRGRSTGRADRVHDYLNNRGPLIRENVVEGNEINGMVIRGETLDTESVWDDTQIAHVLFDEIVVPDFHTYGGLRMISSPEESLVVKLSGPNAGFTATGRPLDIDDRIGGRMQAIGQPGVPVVFTSIFDCTASAGFREDGLPQFETLLGVCPQESDLETTSIYWSEGQTVYAAALDGSAKQALFTLGGDTDSNQFLKFDIDNTTGTLFAAYGVGHAAIELYSYDIASGTLALVNNSDAMGAILQAVGVNDHNGEIYVSPHCYEINTPGCTPGGMLHLTDGGATITPFSQRPYYVQDIEVDGERGHVYYSKSPDSNEVRRMNLDGSSDIQLFGGLSGYPRIALNADSGHLYYGQASSSGSQGAQIIRHDTDGSNATTLLTLDGVEWIGDIDYDSTQNRLFWLAKKGENHFVQSCDPQGNNLETLFAVGVEDADAAQGPGSHHIALYTSFIGTAIPAAPGDWRSITLDQFSHDRNVDTIVEAESATPGEVDSNAVPSIAEFVGHLAPHEKGSDDNLRLGFEIHGSINAPADIDVFSFSGTAGTEVWLDVDDTTHTLDTVVELLDSNSQIIFQSDDSWAETAGDYPIYQAYALQHANVLQKSLYEGQDRWSTNPRDAGMRVVLPGMPGEMGTYHVRIRSSNLAAGDPRSDLQDSSQVFDGITEGAYELQIRLREVDELPGSTVRYSDIRYANNGLEVSGLPSHSPLLGEMGEDLTVNNNTSATAQDLGNLLNSDRAAISVAGSIDPGSELVHAANGLAGRDATDIDWYSLDVVHDSIQMSGGNLVSTIFDLDYADGMARGNLQLHVFNAAGELILTSRDSNIVDDQAGPLAGAHLDDLSRGSAGVLDPYIGTVSLPEGQYFVAVSANSQIPQQLDQYLVPNPANPLVRLEPIDSLERIAEDQIVTSGGSLVADSPRVDVLFDATSPVPFHLGDVVLFVSADGGLNAPNRSSLFTIDPFTGFQETTVGEFDQPHGAIAMRPDGKLFTFATDILNGTPRLADADTWPDDFLLIDAGTAATTAQGLHGIQTYQDTDPSNIVAVGDANVGMYIEALAFSDLAGGNLWGVGNRSDFEGTPPNYPDNILYRFDAVTGQGINAFTGGVGDVRQNEARVRGAGTQVVEAGRMDTGDVTLTAVEATLFTTDPDVTTPLIVDGQEFTVTDNFGVSTTFEFDAGQEVNLAIDLETQTTIRDGDFFQLDDEIFQFDTGAVMVVNAMTDGQQFVINDSSGVNHVFEFDDVGTTPGFVVDTGQTAVLFDSAIPMTLEEFAQTIVTTVNNEAGLSTTAGAVGNRVSFYNENWIDIITRNGDIELEGELGQAPIAQLLDGNGIVNLLNNAAGAGFQVSVWQGPSIGNVLVEFEFTQGGPLVNSAAIPVTVLAGQSAAQVANAMALAIEANSEASARAVGDLVVVNGELIQLQFLNSLPAASAVAQPVTLDAVNTVPALLGQISVEETDSVDQLSTAIGTTVNALTAFTSDITTGFDGARVNFQGPLPFQPPPAPANTPVPFIEFGQGPAAVDFSGTPVMVPTTSQPGTSGLGNVPVFFLAQDTANDMADRITDSISLDRLLNGTKVLASSFAATVRLEEASTATADPPLLVNVNGMNGAITGITFQNGQLFAVDDNGGLYQVQPFGAATTFIANVGGLGIEFTDLAASPANVEGGRYADILFGLDSSGEIFAFDTSGQLAPIFVDSQTSIDSGLPNATGLSFSTLDQNLWHITGARETDPGHGVGPAFDGSRGLQEGSTSFYFGRETGDDTVGNLIDDPASDRRLGSPGGAHGSIVSNPFSLAGYQAADRPVLYFNYYLETAGVDHAGPQEDGVGMTDAVRVFASDDGGEWELLATNNSFQHPINADEFDLGMDGSVCEFPATTGTPCVYELFDVNVNDAPDGWRQARITLDRFAGIENLRLRFDFSTAGSMNVGHIQTTGEELRTIPGVDLRDGDIFVVDGSVNMEFDLGYTLVAPTGKAIQDGAAFTINK
ncbi:MAG: DUF5050 domain-containing protein, partial [Pirellulaceae bacterium]|nr:DUF5050 domain-containing protein [Pirellulaceae bacterium]